MREIYKITFNRRIEYIQDLPADEIKAEAKRVLGDSADYYKVCHSLDSISQAVNDGEIEMIHYTESETTLHFYSEYEKFATDEDVKTFREEVNNLVCTALDDEAELNELCKTGIQISIGGKTLKLYLSAENFNALDSFLEDVIENCEQ